MAASRRNAPRPKLLIVDAGPGVERLERHLVPWIAGLAREHGGFDVAVAQAHVVLRPDRPGRDGRPARWAAAVAAADAALFVTSTRDAGLLELLLDLAGRRDRGWRLKPVAITQPSGTDADRVADLLQAGLRDLHARPLDERLRLPAPAEALAAGADAAEERACAAVRTVLDELYRAHQTLRAFRLHEPFAAVLRT